MPNDRKDMDLRLKEFLYLVFTASATSVIFTSKATIFKGYVFTPLLGPPNKNLFVAIEGLLFGIPIALGYLIDIGAVRRKILNSVATLIGATAFLLTIASLSDGNLGALLAGLNSLLYSIAAYMHIIVIISSVPTFFRPLRRLFASSLIIYAGFFTATVGMAITSASLVATIPPPSILLALMIAYLTIGYLGTLLLPKEAEFPQKKLFNLINYVRVLLRGASVKFYFLAIASYFVVLIAYTYKLHELIEVKFPYFRVGSGEHLGYVTIAVTSYALFSMFALIGATLFTWFFLRLGLKTLVMLAVGLFTVIPPLLGFVENLTLFYLLSAVSGFGLGLIATIVVAFTVMKADPETGGGYAGLLSAAIAVAHFFTSATFTTIETLTTNSVKYIYLALGFWTAVTLLSTYLTFTFREAEAPSNL